MPISTSGNTAPLVTPGSPIRWRCSSGTFSLGDLSPLLDSIHFDGCIAVQAQQNLEVNRMAAATR